MMMPRLLALHAALLGLFALLAAVAHGARSPRAVAWSGTGRLGVSAMRVQARPRAERGACAACAASVAEEALAPVDTSAATAASAAVDGSEERDEEQIFLNKSKADEEKEKVRLADLKSTNFSGFVWELRGYVDQINVTGPPPLAPDSELRDVVLRSSTPPSRLLDDIYNYTLRHVPYEDAMYICAPEQGTLLNLLARAVRARECLDVGSFTGCSAAAVMHALPPSGRLTAIEAKQEYADVAERFLSTLPPTFDVKVGDALQELRKLEGEGRRFDFISIDCDKQQQQAYYEQCLRLLRPRGLLVMFGMMLYPTEEDKQAIDELITLVANDTRVSTTMIPVGCGVQVCTKKGEKDVGLVGGALDGTLAPPADLPVDTQRRNALEVELATIDTALLELERARKARGEYVPHVPPAATSAAAHHAAAAASYAVAATVPAPATVGGQNVTAHAAAPAPAPVTPTAEAEQRVPVAGRDGYNAGAENSATASSAGGS